MCEIATFYLIDTSKFEELASKAEVIIKKSFFSKTNTDEYPGFLKQNAKLLSQVNLDGDYYWTFFMYLKREKGIDIFENEYAGLTKKLIEKRGAFHFIFTFNQKIKLEEFFRYNSCSAERLQRFSEEFSNKGDDKTGELMAEAIMKLQENLLQLQDDRQVLSLILEKLNIERITF